MARTSKRKAACYQSSDLSVADIGKLDALAEKYSSGDINRDYAMAAEDQVSELKELQSAVQDALARKLKETEVKAAPAAVQKTYDWGQLGNYGIPGDYQGRTTRVTDIAKFLKDNPGVQTGVDQLDAAGVGGLMDQVDQIYIAEGDFDGNGAVWFNRETGEVELWYARQTLNKDSDAAFTTRHELGHLADGALGPTGLRAYAKLLTSSLKSEARKVADTDTNIGAILSYPFEYVDEGRQAEELIAQLWAVATGPSGTSLLTPNLGKFIQGVINDAKTNRDRNASQGRRQAEAEYEALESENSGTGQTLTPQRRFSESIRKAGLQPVSSPRFGDKRSGLEDRLNQEFRDRAGASGARLATDAAFYAKKAGLYMMGLHDIVDMYKGTVQSMGRWYDEIRAAAATRRQLEQGAEKIASAYEKLKPQESARVSAYLADATTSQKWGYVPAWKPNAQVDPAMGQRHRGLNPAERAVAEAVFEHGDLMRREKQKALKALGIDGLFTKSGMLDGPYAPLKRFGDHVALLKSQELRDAEAAGDTKKVEELKKDSKHFVAATFDTPGQAAEFARINEPAYGWSDSFNKAVRVDEGRMMKPEMMEKIMAALKMNDSVPQSSRTAMEKMLQDMYLQTLDEQNARTSNLKRQGVAGFEKDMVRSFLSHARAEAGFISGIKHGEKISSLFLEMNNQARNQKTGKREYQDAVNIAADHYADSLNYKETPIQDAIMAGTSAFQLATSVGYHVTNMTQGFMVSLPKLASDFNDYFGAWKHLMRGYETIGKVGTGDNMDLSRVKDEGLRRTLQNAMDAGLLDIGMDSDMTRLEGMRTGYGALDGASNIASSALNKLRKISQTIEAWNRIAAATAAYTMAVEKKTAQNDRGSPEDYAIRMLESTQGDFTRMGSPLLLKKLPKPMVQYRKYQFMMGALYVKAFMQAFKGATPEEKAIGRRMLAYKMFHTSMAAGVLGLPLMNLVGGVFGAMGDGDEPPDLERDLRKWIGDDDLANMLLKGPLSMIGLDMSSKLGDDKIFSIAPYTEFDLTSASGLAKTAAGVLGGPAFSQAGKFADGVGLMRQGEYYKSVEKFMPKGPADVLKAFRIANDGYTLKNGDLMVRPDDINGMALALDALGLPSAELKRMDWLRGQQYEIGQFYQNRSKEITRDYVNAVRDGDSQGMAEAREEFMELQAGKDNLRYLFNDSNDLLKRQPLSTLLKAPQNRDQREKKLQRGVPTLSN